jgi:apolipoprotein D and lipocalin family protein
MIPMIIKAMLIFGIISSILFGCATGMKQAEPPLQVVPHVDLDRYLGTWYEIARFPFRLQEGCVATQATYTLLEHGKIGVLNQCRKHGFDEELSTAKGKAWIVDKETNAKIKVRFFGLQDYWIIDLGKNYDYAVVSQPEISLDPQPYPQMDETL